MMAVVEWHFKVLIKKKNSLEFRVILEESKGSVSVM